MCIFPFFTNINFNSNCTTRVESAVTQTFRTFRTFEMAFETFNKKKKIYIFTFCFKQFVPFTAVQTSENHIVVELKNFFLSKIS